MSHKKSYSISEERRQFSNVRLRSASIVQVGNAQLTSIRIALLATTQRFSALVASSTSSSCAGDGKLPLPMPLADGGSSSSSRRELKHNARQERANERSNRRRRRQVANSRFGSLCVCLCMFVRASASDANDQRTNEQTSILLSANTRKHHIRGLRPRKKFHPLA